MRRIMLAGLFLSAVGFTMPNDAIADPPKKTTVKSTGYEADGKTVKWQKEKEAPVAAPDTTTVTLEVLDPKTGKLAFKVERAPAHMDRLGAWILKLNHATTEKPGVGDRITDVDGKAYKISEKPTAADGGHRCKCKAEK